MSRPSATSRSTKSSQIFQQKPSGTSTSSSTAAGGAGSSSMKQQQAGDSEAAAGRGGKKIASSSSGSASQSQSAAAAGRTTGVLHLPPASNEIHPLKEDWTYYYVHRPPGSKVIEYEKEIKKVASFGSTESFWNIYAHLLPPKFLPAVTDLLLFASKIKRPVWEELPNGGKWTLRLRKGVADRMWEDMTLALIGDQFEEDEGIVGIVLSVRGQEDILSVWSDREVTGGGGSALRDKLLGVLGLSANAAASALGYKSNRSLLESAAQKSTKAASSGDYHRAPGSHHDANGGGHERHGHGHFHRSQRDRS